jgi:hypothetical protein
MATGKHRERTSAEGVVVSSIVMKEFRRTVVDALIDHGQKLRLRWAFLPNVVPALVDHAHRFAMAVGSASSP